MESKKNIPCPALAVLEQYSVHGEEPGLPGTLATHLKNCTACRTKLDTLRTEAGLIARLLKDTGAASSQCPDPETMACYLDGSLSEKDRLAHEGHMAACAACRGALVALYREVKLVIAEAPGDVSCGAPIVLKDAKSPKAVVNVDIDALPRNCEGAQAPLPVPDVEPRKKRYMSESG